MIPLPKTDSWQRVGDALTLHARTLSVDCVQLSFGGQMGSIGVPFAAPALHPLRSWDPQRRGPWLLLGRVGSGGMGTVYLGEHVETGQRAAVKVMSDALAEEPGFRDRFAREIETLRLVEGPFAASVLGGDADAEQPWLATEYVPAPDLLRLVCEAGPLDSASWQGLAVGLVTALADLHAAGVLHRDLKPSNILLAPDGPRLIDFGIAHVAGATGLTATGLGMGTPGWLAPETVRGEDATSASDLFAAGSVLAFAATGRAPFGDSIPGAVMHAVLEREPDLVGASGYAQIVLSGLLDKDPAQRWDADRCLEFLTGSGDRRAAGARATQIWRASSAATRIQAPLRGVDPALAQRLSAVPAASAQAPAGAAVGARTRRRRALWMGILTGLLLVVPASGLAGWWAIGGGAGTKQAGADADRPAETPRMDPQPERLPLIDYYPSTDEGRTSAQTMSAYLTAINDHDGYTMCSMNEVAPCDELLSGTAQSAWSGVSIGEARRWSPSEIQVSFSGTTTQPASMGPDGETCTDWELEYTLTRRDSAWRITDTGPSSHTPC